MKLFNARQSYRLDWIICRMEAPPVLAATKAFCRTAYPVIDSQTAQLLDHLHRGGQWGYWWTMEARQSFWWEVGKRGPLPGGRRNVYVGVHPTTEIPKTNPRGEPKAPREVRAQLGVIAALNCLYSELDAKDFGGDKAAVMAHIAQIDPQPSVLVDSGGGYHLYHLFAEPWLMRDDETREQAKRLQAAWVAYIGSDPAVKDLARVLRVPGTLNYKYTPPRPVAIVSADYNRLYAHDELAAYCAHLMSAVRAESPAPEPSARANGSGRERYAQAALDGELAAILRAPPGMKHDTIRNAAIKLGTLVGAGLLDENQVLDEITRAAGLHRDDVRDTYRTALDGLAYGKARPRELPRRAHSEYSGYSEERAFPQTTQTTPAWGVIVPFHTLDLPTFPTDIFADWLRDFVEAVAVATQTPPDLAGMLALAALSTACARHVAVEARSGWREPVNIFAITSLPPANRKSAVFAAMSAPIIAYERERVIAARQPIAEGAARRDVAEQRLEHAKRDAAKQTRQADILNAMEEVDRLAAELAVMAVPSAPRLVVDDITPEALATIMSEQDGRIAVLSPEGDIFNIMAGRYSSGAPNFAIYLKSHAGDTIRVDRRSRSEYIHAPALTMGLTVQPDVLRSFADRGAFRGQGLLGRFLYALPLSMVGARRIDPPPVPDATRETYHQMMYLLIGYAARGHSEYSGYSEEARSESGESEKNCLNNDSANILLKLSQEAAQLFTAFQEWLEPQLGEHGAFAGFTDWAGKLAGTVLRCAALLAMADRAPHNSHIPHNAPIDEYVMARALRLAEYLIAHARAAFAEIGADPAVAAARRIIRWMEETQVSEFTKRDAYQALRGAFKRASELDPALELLTDHGYIRPLDGDDRPGPGRKPSQRYEVNPALCVTHNSRNTQNVIGSIALPFDLVTHNPHIPQNGAAFDVDYDGVRVLLSRGREADVRAQCAEHGLDADEVIAVARGENDARHN